MEWLGGWVEGVFLFDFLGGPVNYLKKVLMAFQKNPIFKPSNDGFIIFYHLVAYPLLWIGTQFQVWTDFAGIPWVIFYYLIDPYIFIDKEGEERENRPVVKKGGLAQRIASRYAIKALLFGDYKWL